MGDGLLIEGYKTEQLREALGSDLESEILKGRPIVARTGSAEILIALAVEGATLRAELAHVDGGGEGVLLAIMGVILRIARRRQLKEWLVFATNCARPNPRLRPIVEHRGFVVREIPPTGLLLPSS